MEKKTQKISICTVSMNRTHHIKETLEKNILDNIGYGNFEFILLDYSSSDNLKEYIEDNLSKHTNTGMLKYYRINNKKYFDRSHSRNVAIKLATGDIVCNVDADNFIGKGYLGYVNDIFNQKENIFLVADTKKRKYFLRNAFGRFCVKKVDFDKARGMDELMSSYGSETIDLYNRLEDTGLREEVIKDTNFLKAISHDDNERIENEYFLKEIKNLYIRYISHKSSEYLLLYKNSKFETGYLENEDIGSHLPAKLINDSFYKGSFSIENNQVIIETGENKRHFTFLDEDLHETEEKIFQNISDRNFLEEIAKNYSFITNSDRMDTNQKTKNIINENGFGLADIEDISGVITTLK
jgi:hypothetical protein